MGDQEPNHEARAYRAWPVLVDCAARHSTITYTRLGQRIGGVHQRAIGYTLGPVQDNCLDERLPPLTILVVRKSAGHPGGGFVAWDIDDIETGLERVYEYPWASLLNPFAYAADETVTLDVLAEELLQNPGIAGDVYARVRVRGVAQQTFRRALLEAYEHACAFCGMTFCDSLEAAHIVPWTSCTQSERLDPQNGLLLCGTHHALFDARFLTINANYQLRHTDDTYELDQYTTADLWFTRRLDGCQIRLPQREHLRPALKYIEKRNSA